MCSVPGKATTAQEVMALVDNLTRHPKQAPLTPGDGGGASSGIRAGVPGRTAADLAGQTLLQNALQQTSLAQANLAQLKLPSLPGIPVVDHNRLDEFVKEQVQSQQVLAKAAAADPGAAASLAGSGDVQGTAAKANEILERVRILSDAATLANAEKTWIQVRGRCVSVWVGNGLEGRGYVCLFVEGEKEGFEREQLSGPVKEGPR
jgi:hypothetical protein